MKTSEALEGITVIGCGVSITGALTKQDRRMSLRNGLDAVDPPIGQEFSLDDFREPRVSYAFVVHLKLNSPSFNSSA